jgi:hypothetical protein
LALDVLLIVALGGLTVAEESSERLAVKTQNPASRGPRKRSSKSSLKNKVDAEEIEKKYEDLIEKNKKGNQYSPEQMQKMVIQQVLSRVNFRLMRNGMIFIERYW